MIGHFIIYIPWIMHVTRVKL